MVRETEDVAAPDEDLAVLGADFPVERPQEGRLARAARPGDEAELALLDLEADVGKGPLRPVILDPDADEFDYFEKL